MIDGLPFDFPGQLPALIVEFVCDASIGHRDDAIGHSSDRRVMRNDSGSGAQFAVDSLNHFQHQDPRGYIQRAGGFVA